MSPTPTPTPTPPPPGWWLPGGDCTPATCQPVHLPPHDGPPTPFTVEPGENGTLTATPAVPADPGVGAVPPETYTERAAHAPHTLGDLTPPWTFDWLSGVLTLLVTAAAVVAALTARRRARRARVTSHPDITVEGPIDDTDNFPPPVVTEPVTEKETTE